MQSQSGVKHKQVSKSERIKKTLCHSSNKTLSCVHPLASPLQHLTSGMYALQWVVSAGGPAGSQKLGLEGAIAHNGAKAPCWAELANASPP